MRCEFRLQLPRRGIGRLPGPGRPPRRRPTPRSVGWGGRPRPAGLEKEDTMRLHRLGMTLLCFVLLLGACYPGRASSGSGQSPDLIGNWELQELPDYNALDAIRRLRPAWLRGGDPARCRNRVERGLPQGPPERRASVELRSAGRDQCNRHPRDAIPQRSRCIHAFRHGLCERRDSDHAGALSDRFRYPPRTPPAPRPPAPACGSSSRPARCCGTPRRPRTAGSGS